jgi:hypothetical protein
MTPIATLVLRDVHRVPVPSWWPPPPGWWVVMGSVALLLLVVAARQAWKRRQRRRWQQLFDATVPTSLDPPRQVAEMTELLRRAAHRRQPGAELLEGPTWLTWLDAHAPVRPDSAGFSQGEGQLLLDGGYRRTLDAGAVARVRQRARDTFVALMTGQRR